MTALAYRSPRKNKMNEYNLMTIRELKKKGKKRG